MANCIVFGGNGFLGSYLVDELAERGHRVVAFDRFSSGQPLFSSEGVETVAADFMDAGAVKAALAGMDRVFHFVSTTTPASSEDNPAEDARTTITASVDLFSLAADAGVKRDFFASTGGAIYGDQAKNSIAETTVPEPVSPYAIGKLAVEGYLHYFARKRGLASVAFRISNPYGPRQPRRKVQGVIPIFLRRHAAGLPLQVQGDGSMVRDYLYASDAARMIATAAEGETRFNVYNVGSGEGTSLNDLVHLIGEVTGVEPLVEHTEVPSTFLERSVLDMSRFLDEFGSVDLFPLRDGIEATWHAIQAEESQI